jgi:hypothetical protein
MKNLAFAALLILLAGCAHTYNMAGYNYNEQDYKYHKHTIFINLHWNITHPDNDTVVAEGFVEPFSVSDGLRAVRLSLVGLDDQGRVVNSSDGLPRDTYIESPFYPASPFKISLKRNGKERIFTIIGSYYHYELGTASRFERFDYIPITSR